MSRWSCNSDNASFASYCISQRRPEIWLLLSEDAMSLRGRAPIVFSGPSDVGCFGVISRGSSWPCPPTTTPSYKSSGTRPISCSLEGSNCMPVLAAKHWRTIHRSGILSRRCLTSLGTQPPPTSASTVKFRYHAMAYCTHRHGTPRTRLPGRQFGEVPVLLMPVPCLCLSIGFNARSICSACLTHHLLWVDGTEFYFASSQPTTL